MNTLIKINSKISEPDLRVILENAEKIDGVTKVSFNDDILSYSITEHSSDYDVMVKILDLIEDLGYDAEPLFEGAEEMANAVNEHVHEHDHNHEHTHEHDCHEHHCNERHHDHQHHEHDHHCHEHHEEGGLSFCSCHNHAEEEKGSFKGKIIELSISLITLILGIILSNVESTKEVSRYVLVVAFAVAGYEVIVDGLIGIFKLKPFSENTLMALASISAMFLGETVEAVGIMLLYGVGELFEKTVTGDATKIINALKSYKDEKVKIIGEGGIEVSVNAECVNIGDVIVLRAGEKLALDGEIIEGSGSFDTKVITGENAYKDLNCKDTVLGGYVLVNGTVKISVQKPYSESAVSRIANIVESSAKKKSKPEKFLEKFAKWYTPCVVILAILLAFIPPFFETTYVYGLKIWGIRAIMLLCISCPCSLVISIPLAYFMGVANLAKKGVISKNSATIEKLSKVKTVVFDKTGTLTEGVLKITKIISTKKYQGEVLRLASICEKFSNHPIAVALREKEDVTNEVVKDYKEFAGKGVSCVYNGKNLMLGNEKFLNENGVNVIDTNYIGTKLYLAVDGECAGVIVLNDTLRKTAKGCILELHDCGVENSVMLTGDNKEYAVSVRKELKMKSSISQLLPEEKVLELEKILGAQTSPVAFVGDGVNDAPAITRADVGIAMGGVGSDAVIDCADVILTTDDLSKIPYALKLAKRTAKIAKQNLILSLGVKFLVMLLSVFGITTSLWLAIGADVGLLVITILNSIRNKFEVI